MPQTLDYRAFADRFPFRAPCPGGCGSHLLRERVNDFRAKLSCMECSWVRFARRTPSGGVQISKSPLFDDVPPLPGVERTISPLTGQEVLMAARTGSRLTRSEYQRWVRQGRPDLDKWIADGKPFLKKGRRRAGLASTPAAAVSKPATPFTPAAPTRAVMGLAIDIEPVESGRLELPPGTTAIAVYRINSYVTVCSADGLVLHQIKI